MITLTKDGGIKTVSNEELIKILLASGWTEVKEEIIEKKDVKNGKARITDSK